MRMMLVLTLILAACGADDDDNNTVIVVNADSGGEVNSTNQGPGGSGGTNVVANGEPGTRAFDIRAGITAPASARQLRDEIRVIGVSAVFEATNQANGGQQLVFTGTLTQQGQQFVYSTGPSDSLRIVWSEGAPTDFYFTALDGDFNVSPDRFVQRTHNIQLRAAREGLLDMTLNSQKQSGQEGFSLQGWANLQGVRFQFNVNETGTYRSSSDFGAAEYESETNLTGTVTADNGYEQEVQEYFRFELVNDVTNDDRISNSTWTANGKRYQLDNLRVRFEQIRGYPNVNDYWLIEGNLYEDDVLIGQAGWEANDLFISIFMLVGDEKIELYNFQRLQD